MKYRVQKIAGIKSSMPMIYISVEIFMLSFCFVELTIGNPLSKYNPPTECPHILGWNANDASTCHLKIPFQLELRLSEVLRVILMYCIRCTILSQSPSSCARTLFFINATDVQVSDIPLLVIYKVFATILWNSMNFY